MKIAFVSGLHLPPFFPKTTWEVTKSLVGNFDVQAELYDYSQDLSDLKCDCAVGHSLGGNDALAAFNEDRCGAALCLDYVPDSMWDQAFLIWPTAMRSGVKSLHRPKVGVIPRAVGVLGADDELIDADHADFPDLIETRTLLIRYATTKKWRVE